MSELIMYEDGTLRSAVNVSTATPLPVSLGGTVAVSPGSLGKAEDAVAANGDVGIAIFGVRAPTVPTPQTSAPGDYGTFMIDNQGKQVVKLNSNAESTWQTSQAIIVNTDVVAVVAASAGLRNCVTDITVSNSSAAAALFQLKDGAVVVFQVWVGAGVTLTFDLMTPIRSSPATAINVNVSVATTTMYVSLVGYIGV